MKAAVYRGIEDIRLEEWKKPACGAKEILLKVRCCAICGTDLRIFLHGHKKVNPPAIIGHEITGEVAEIGKEVRYPGLKVGDKVTVVTSIGCGKCKICRDGFYNLCPDTRAIGYFWPGGFAEYVVIPEPAVEQQAVLKLPDNLGFPEGTLIEPLSCAINGQRYLGIKNTDTVVIFGGGPIGLMHASLAQAVPCQKVIVIDPAYERLVKFGKQFAGLVMWNPAEINVKEQIKKETGGFGADVVITACPVKQAQMESLEILGSKGRISFFGGLPKDDSVIQIDANLIHYKEISVFGAFASNRKDYVQAGELLATGKVNAGKFITKVLPLKEISDGFQMVRKGEVLKAVVRVTNGE